MKNHALRRRLFSNVFYMAFFACLLATASVFGLSERDAVLAAIKSNPGLRILFINRIGDSLTLAATRVAWLPTVSLSAKESIVPIDTSASSRSNNSRTETSAGISAAQKVPGGGTAQASFGPSWTTYSLTDSIASSLNLSASITQPLLRNAWALGSQDVAIRLAVLDSRRSLLDAKKQLVGTVSEIRRLYWSLYQAQKSAGIYDLEIEYSRKNLDATRKRFEVGAAAPLDTLEAKLEYLQTLQRQSGEQRRLLQAQRDLALALALPADAAVADTTQIDTVYAPPAPGTFLSECEKIDPGLAVFSLLKEKYDLQLRQSRNQLLPQLDASVSFSQSMGGDAAPDVFKSRNASIALIVNYALPITPQRIAVRRAGLTMQKNNIDWEQYRTSLERKIAELWETLDLDKNDLVIAGASLDVARKKLDAASAGRTVGSVDYLTYLKARTDFTNTALEYLNKLIELKRLEISFDEVSGMVLSRFGVSIE